MLEELIEFAKRYHDGFTGATDAAIRRMFLTYKDSTLINQDEQGRIIGCAVYQEWPDCLNFICIIGNPENDPLRNITAMMDGRENLPAKPIVFFDEKTMRLRGCK